MLVAFFKRLVGQDAEATETQRKFTTSLNAMNSRREGLEVAGATIAAIIKDVDRKKAEIALSKTISGISGEHRLSLSAKPESTK